MNTVLASVAISVLNDGCDGAGRTTSVVTGAGTTTVAYDYEGRISQITYPSTATNTFAYNGLDTRVSKVDSAGTATYKRDGAHVTAPVISDGSAVYTPGISERRSSTTKYYGSDRLGTNALETNSSQAVTATKTYDAFGMPVASTGSSASPFGFAGQHGYQEDADSGLKLLGHRYYDASTGRFLTRDPIKDGRNWYGYCDSNPISNIDSEGLQTSKVLGDVYRRARNVALRGGRRIRTYLPPEKMKHIWEEHHPGKILPKNDWKGKWNKGLTWQHLSQIIDDVVQHGTKNGPRSGKGRSVYDQEFNGTTGSVLDRHSPRPRGVTGIRVVVEDSTGKIITAFPIDSRVIGK